MINYLNSHSLLRIKIQNFHVILKKLNTIWEYVTKTEIPAQRILKNSINVKFNSDKMSNFPPKSLKFSCFKYSNIEKKKKE